MKKRFLIPILLFASSSLFSCGSSLKYFDDDEAKNSSILLSSNKLTIEVGQIVKLEYLVFNTDAKPVFSTNDNSVAIVDGDGNITGVGIGTAIISADLNEKHYSCEVNVLAAKQYYIYLENDDVVVEVGSTFELNPVLTKTGDDVVEATFTYKSNSNSIFTVNNNIVNGVSAGEDELLITAQYENVEYYKLLTVKVI